MKRWLRRIRGAVGMGLTWAAGWFGVGAVLNPLGAVFGAGPAGMVELIFYAVAGFVGGTAFSVVLGITEGRRRFDQMSLPRFATWGGFGGLLAMIAAYMIFDGMRFSLDTLLGLAAVTLLGAGSAAGSLALARRADDSELLEAGADVADVGLSEGEARELLGRM